MKLYAAIAQNARLIDSPIHGVHAKARQARIDALLPSGSGFDNGTQLVSVTDEKIIFETAFHHMNDNGMYCGWTNHRVIVKASLTQDFVVECRGQNKRDIRAYIEECFSTALFASFDWLTVQGE